MCQSDHYSANTTSACHIAMPPALKTKRLSLRLLRPGDLDVVHALFSSTGHTIGDGPIGESALTLGWLQRRRRLHEESGLAWYGLWVATRASWALAAPSSDAAARRLRSATRSLCPNEGTATPRRPLGSSPMLAIWLDMRRSGPRSGQRTSPRFASCRPTDTSWSAANRTLGDRSTTTATQLKRLSEAGSADWARTGVFGLIP